MFLKLADADLFVTAFGNGSTQFVAHGGWVGSGELWHLCFGELSRHWRTLTYDHRGTGATVNRAPRITFEMLVDDLFRVLDAHRIERCILAGESSGTLVVLAAALRQPDRFSGLVLVDGRPGVVASAGAQRFIEGCKQDFAATMDAFARACVTEPGAESERRWAKQIVMRSNGPEAVQLMECVQGVGFEDRLGDIHQPTLLIHGRQDAITPVAASERMAEKIPNSRLVVLEDAGHVPVMTRPDVVAREIRAFFPDA